jgi:hypothetical protein
VRLDRYSCKIPQAPDALSALQGSGKYAAINIRRVANLRGADLERALIAVEQLNKLGVVDTSEPGSPEEFFLVKLKDRHSRPALLAYGQSVLPFDKEYGNDVLSLAVRAGCNHPNCKEPD